MERSSRTAYTHTLKLRIWKHIVRLNWIVPAHFISTTHMMTGKLTIRITQFVLLFHSISIFFLLWFWFSKERHQKRQGTLYIQVEPKIIVGAQKSSKEIPLDSIRCQTMLAKCMGPLSTWENKLIVAKNSGYNMIHFTPIQVTTNANTQFYFRSVSVIL